MYLYQLSDDDLMNAMHALEELDFFTETVSEVNYLSLCIWANLQEEDMRRVSRDNAYEELLNEGHALFMEEQVLEG